MTLSTLLLCASETGEPLQPEQWVPLIQLAQDRERATTAARLLCADARQTVGSRTYLPGDPAALIAALDALPEGDA